MFAVNYLFQNYNYSVLQHYKKKIRHFVTFLCSDHLVVIIFMHRHKHIWHWKKFLNLECNLSVSAKHHWDLWFPPPIPEIARASHMKRMAEEQQRAFSCSLQSFKIPRLTYSQQGIRRTYFLLFFFITLAETSGNNCRKIDSLWDVKRPCKYLF